MIINAPSTPSAAASEGVANPVIIDPSTTNISKIGGTKEVKNSDFLIIFSDSRVCFSMLTLLRYIM